MKIALITTGLGMGGAEVLVKELALRLARRGNSVTIISLKAPEYFVDELEHGGVRVISAGFVGGLGDGWRLLRVLKWLRAMNPNATHAHLFHANMVARVAGLFRIGGKIICSVHNTYEVSSRAAIVAEDITPRERIYRWTDSWCDITAQISLKGLARYRRLGIVSEGRSTMVYNGLNLSTISPKKEKAPPARADYGAEGEFLWVAIGRHVEQKNFPLLINVAAMLHARGLKFKIWIFGEGPLFDKHRREIELRNLQEVVFLGGVRLNVRAILPLFDGFVLSSNFEGLPVVLIEAAATGLPIVSTDTGGCAEVFDAANGGGVVNSGDNQQLCDAMTTVMQSSMARRFEMGAANRQRALRLFDIDAISQQWEAIYQ